MMKKASFFMCVFFFLFCGNVFAQKEDLRLIAEGKYFEIFGYKGIDVDYITSKLNFDYFLYPDNLFEDEDGGIRNALAKTIDAIYMEVSDVLDIHSYNFYGKIKIVLSQKEVAEAFKEKFARDFSERSIYFLDEKTIYISGEDMTLGMIGHEIAHAIINHYFVVPPSKKMQEILAGYVEYSLNKKIAAQVKF